MRAPSTTHGTCEGRVRSALKGRAPARGQKRLTSEEKFNGHQAGRTYFYRRAEDTEQQGTLVVIQSLHKCHLRGDERKCKWSHPCQVHGHGC